jgi:hypothetical protein
MRQNRLGKPSKIPYNAPKGWVLNRATQPAILVIAVTDVPKEVVQETKVNLWKINLAFQKI